MSDKIAMQGVGMGATALQYSPRHYFVTHSQSSKNRKNHQQHRIAW